jgi:Xaa-Pro aminopeptidase
MGAHEIDALLVSNPKDIRYLTGFVGDDSLLVVGADGAAIVSDTRYDEFLEPWRQSPGTDVVMGTRHRLEDSVASQCREQGIRRLGLQAEHLSVAGRQKLASRIDKRGLVDTEGLVGRLRRRKDDLEVAAIERAVAIQQEALAAALNRLSLGMTEMALGARLEYEMKVRGAAGPSFETMIARGPHSSVIHYLTGEAPIENGTLLIDWGATVDGYCSDMTRTFGLGPLPEKVRMVYPIVLEAQQAAIDACRPGRTCAEIDAVARDLIEAAGYGEQFGHGLGHGLGLDVHEEPYFNRLATDVVLEPGMVMTVEPGIYLPGVGGVRIEDDVLITAGGRRVLSSYPRDPTAAVIEPAGRVGAKEAGRPSEACHD